MRNDKALYNPKDFLRRAAQIGEPCTYFLESGFKTTWKEHRISRKTSTESMQQLGHRSVAWLVWVRSPVHTAFVYEDAGSLSLNIVIIVSGFKWHDLEYSRIPSLIVCSIWVLTESLTENGIALVCETQNEIAVASPGSECVLILGAWTGPSSSHRMNQYR